MQLNFFDRMADKSEAEIVAFPADRQRRLIALAADELMARSKRSGQRFWNSHLAALRRERSSWGMTKAEITIDLEAYSQAVSRELNVRLNYRGSSDVG